MLWNSSRDELYTAEWVVPCVLARSQRPGYPVDRPSASKIVAWAERVREMGVRGILCILDDSQLAHYNGLGLDGGGLLAYYRSLGFAVRHVTADDHKRPPHCQVPNWTRCGGRSCSSASRCWCTAARVATAPAPPYSTFWAGSPAASDADNFAPLWYNSKTPRWSRLASADVPKWRNGRRATFRA